MPLPAYLLERLKKRNVISENVEEDKSVNLTNTADTIQSYYEQNDEQDVISLRERNLDSEDQEEIIAEDYSDDEESDDEQTELTNSNKPQEVEGKQDIERDTSSIKSNDDEQVGEEELTETTTNNPKHNSSSTCGVSDDTIAHSDDNDEKTPSNYEAPNLPVDVSHKSVLGCPNKYNIYHHCSKYCIENYSNPKNTTPTMEQRKQLALILKTYPITNEWTVVYDPGVQTFYFWNIITNLVSWLPPSMNGLISVPADQIRNSMTSQQDQQQKLPLEQHQSD